MTDADLYLWTVARSARSRPLCMHAVSNRSAEYTECGWLLTGWSRSYMDRVIPVIACRLCARKLGINLDSVGTRSRLTLVS